MEGLIKDLSGILLIVNCECDKLCDVAEYLHYKNCQKKTS